MGNNNKWGLYDPRAPRNVSPVALKSSVGYRFFTAGSWSSYGYHEFRHKSVRPTYVSSPLITLPGTTTKWRPPTAYERRVYSQITNQKYEMFGRLNGGGIGRRVEGPLNTTDFTNGATSSSKRAPFIRPDSDPYDDVDFANARSRAVTECLVKLGDQKADIGTALAELVKTTNHLADTAVDIWKSVKALKGRRWGELASILSKRRQFAPKVNPGMTAAKYWLEYSYAWMPLLMEAKGLYDLYQVQLEPAMLVHANRTVSWPTSFNVKMVGANWYDTYGSGTVRVKTESCCRLTGQLDSSAMRYAAQAGLTNPAAVLWEVVPFSFVIDWATPIGNVLQAASATRGLTFVGGSITQRYYASAFVTCDASSIGGAWSYTTVKEGQTEIYKFGMKRSKLSAFPRPLFYSKSPFSSSHVLSALALIRSLI